MYTHTHVHMHAHAQRGSAAATAKLSLPSRLPPSLPARLSPRGLRSRVTPRTTGPSLASLAHWEPRLCFGGDRSHILQLTCCPPCWPMGMALRRQGQASPRDGAGHFERGWVYDHPFSWRLSWLAALPAGTGWGAAANPPPWCLSMPGRGFWGSPHPPGSPRVKRGLALRKGLGMMWAATHGGIERGRWGGPDPFTWRQSSPSGDPAPSPGPAW